MRELKFRTFVKDEKKMIYYNHSAMALKIFTPNYAYLNSEVEVMQYTGLKDRNGKEIFEGDIVEFTDILPRFSFIEKIGEVKFKDGSFYILSKSDCSHFRWMDYEIKVIGNVHEMPDWDF